MDQGLLYRLLCLLLRPVAEFCLRHSLKVQDAEACLRQVFVEASRDEIAEAGEKITSSRLSVMTGLHRREVVRIMEGEAQRGGSGGLITKVIGQWQTDPRYSTRNGQPKVLPARGSFHDLVRSVSRDLNPATVLFELERMGAVERIAQGIRLAIKEYMPRTNVAEGFEILSADVGDLIATAEENLLEDYSIRQLHLRTEYDKVRLDRLEEIQKWILKEGHALHQRARSFISKFDQDVNPDLKYKGGYTRVVLGGFGRVVKKQHEEIEK